MSSPEERMSEAAHGMLSWLGKYRGIVGITGGTGSGKTTLCRCLQIFGIKVIYPGQFVRGQKVQTGSGMAPDESESLIREVIKSHERIFPFFAVVVDGFPRSLEQARWAHTLALQYDSDFSYVVVHAPWSVRWERVKKRGDDWDKRMADRRFAREIKELGPLLADLEKEFVKKGDVVNGIG